ncbi:alpha/beta hydrolase family esterase [Actinoallomurus sp. CA-150999]|uniref:alpha/beta hydrolase family esterase n=1 Tax=Actinoallomurus sp. CA-150999 TaxID=3239887 RepID=UPI003D8B4464
MKIEVGTPGHREYLVHVPPALGKQRFRAGRPARPLPVVLALHGGADNMTGFEKKSGFDALADDHGFLAVYPDGFAFTWNAGDCCAPARLAHIDDVGFLRRLIDHLTAIGLADPKRVYVTGFSNGGGMAYRFACEAAGKVAAIGVVSAALAMSCHPGRPVPVMIWHGTADHNVPFNGGGHRDFNDRRPFPPVSRAVDFWRRADRLPALRTAEDGGCRSTGRGDGGAEVVLCVVKGGGHQWPSDASGRLWDFFAAHYRM